MAAAVSQEESSNTEDRRAEATTAGDRDSGRRAASAGDPSMAISVTRHAHFSGPEEWKCLACRVDSLDMSLHVDWGSGWEELFQALEQGKEAATGSKGVLWGNGSWVIRPSGKPPMYRFHLERPGFHLFIGKSQNGARTANAFASLGAHVLWHEGVREACILLLKAIEELGGRVLDIKPSRCDLCADFLIPNGLTLEFLRQYRVPANTKIRLEEEGRNLETVYVGSRNAPVLLRIYNKSTEMSVKGDKEWLWAEWGIKPSDNVWRVEFQLRREALRDFDVNNLPTLRAKLGGLWDYLTTKWVSFRYPDNANASRRTVHPWWEAVAEQAERFGDVVSLKRGAVRGPAPPGWYVSHVAGCLVGFAARTGILDPGKACSELAELVLALWAERDFASEYKVRRIQLGCAPDAGRANS